MVDLSTGKTAMPAKKRKKARRHYDREDFYVARRRAGLTQQAAAEMLDVTLRTIRNWENGKSAIPYAAFRLMRLAGGYSLLGKGWEGWILQRGVLYSPENRSFQPYELRYIAHYIAMARSWFKLYMAQRPSPPRPLDAPASSAVAAQPQTLSVTTASAKASRLPPASRVPPSLSGARPLREASQSTSHAAGLQENRVILQQQLEPSRFGAIAATEQKAFNGRSQFYSIWG